MNLLQYRTLSKAANQPEEPWPRAEHRALDENETEGYASGHNRHDINDCQPEHYLIVSCLINILVLALLDNEECAHSIARITPLNIDCIYAGNVEELKGVCYGVK